MKTCGVLVLVLSTNTVWGSSDTIGPNGIDSASTGLDGSGVVIGQGELGRSGKPGFDTAPFYASNTIPEAVYYQTSSQVFADTAADSHATEVAGVMIGQNIPCATCVGVAPGASLHSLAIIDIEDDYNVAITLNRLATLSADPKAINLSITPPLEFFAPDGNSQMTQFIDWSAGRHDVLYVVAWGNDGGHQYRKLTDNYNGITVAGSERFGGTYSKFWEGNSTTGDAAGDRTSIDLFGTSRKCESVTKATRRFLRKVQAMLPLM